MDSKSPEQEIFQKIEEANFDPQALNTPMSEEFLYNRRGNHLHVRTLWPADTEPSALVVFLHGYSSHANRPPIKHLSQQVLANNFAFVTMDFYGHGYSEGLKGYIQSEDDCVDDVLSLLLALYSDKNETEYFKLLRNASTSLPFYLIGHSMGGAVTILLSNMLTNVTEPASHTEHSLTKVEDILRLSPNFRGSVLLCPAIEIPKPPPATIFVLANFLRPLFPEVPIPGLMGSSDDGQIFADARYTRYVHVDQQPENEKGLSWGGTIRFQTAYSILTMTERVIESLSHVSFPFLVLHDPQDAVCFFHGVERLVAESATASEDKTLISVENGLHDLTSNKLGLVTETTIAWIKDRQSRGAQSTANTVLIASNEEAVVKPAVLASLPVTADGGGVFMSSLDVQIEVV